MHCSPPNGCCQHLQGKNTSFSFAKGARAYHITDFHVIFDEICRFSPECRNYLKLIGFGHWKRSYFAKDWFNVMTSNVAESLNVILNEARKFPIIYIFKSIRMTLMIWFVIHWKRLSLKRVLCPQRFRIS